jgi:hypothetical protein
MPRPIPVNRIPPALPRRAAGIRASTAGAASTIRKPPVIPAASRARISHRRENGTAQAASASTVPIIEPRRAGTRPKRRPIRPPPAAPIR